MLQLRGVICYLTACLEEKIIGTPVCNLWLWFEYFAGVDEYMMVVCKPLVYERS